MNTPTAADTKPRRRRLRRGLTALAALVLLLILLLLLLPTLLSAGPGTRLALSVANRFIPGRVAVNDLSVGWFSGTHLHGVTLYDPDGKTVATLDALDAGDATLLALLTGKQRLGELILAKPLATVVRYADGSTNIERSLVAAPEKSAPGKPSTASRKPEPSSVGSTPIGKLLPRFTLKQIDGQVTYSDAAILPVVLSAPRLMLAVDDGGRVGMDFDASVNQGDDAGRVTGTVKLANLWDARGQLQLAAADTDADVSLSSIPIDAVDRMLNQNEALTALVGPSLSATLKAQGRMSKLRAVLTVQAQNLDVNLRTDTTTNDKGVVTLTASAGSPSTAKLRFTPDAYAKWTGANASGGTGAKLLQPVVVELDLRKLQLAQTVRGVDLAGAALDLVAQVSDVQLDAGGEVGRVGLTGTTLQVQTERLADGLTASLTAAASQQNQPSGNVALTARLRNLVDAQGQLQPRALTAQVGAKVTQFPLAVADELAQQRGLLVKNLGPTLDLTADADLAGPAAGQSLPTGTAKLNAQSERLTLNATGRLQSGKPITANFDLGWREPTTNAVLAATGDAAVHNAATSGGGKPMNAVVNLNVAQAPVGLIDQLAGQGGKLTALLGDAIQNITLTTDATLGAPLAADVRVVIHDDRLKADLGADYRAGQPLKVRDGSTASLAVTPAAFAAYQKLPATGDGASPAGEAGRVALRLEEPMTLQLTIRRAVVPIEGAFDLGRLNAAVSATASRMVLREPGAEGQRFAVSDLVLNLDALNPRESVTLDFDGKIDRLAPTPGIAPTPGNTSAQASPAGPPAPQAAAPTLRSRNRLTQLFTEQGAFNFAAARIATDTQLAAMPVALLDGLLDMRGKLADTFGDTATLAVAGAVPGDLDVGLDSPRASAKLPLQLSPRWTTALRGDAVATLQITERLVQSWLGQAMPMLADAVSSEKPIKLTLQQQRFDAPLQNFDIKKVVAFGKLEMGVIQMRRRGWLAQGLSGGLGLLGQRLGLGRMEDLFGGGDAQTYPATFTPITFRLRNGNLRLWESWMTSPDLALGFNGVVDLNRSRIDLTLGLLGATLIKGVGSDLAKAVKPAAVYETPITGALGNPDIKWGKLAEQLLGAYGKGEIISGLEGLLGGDIPKLGQADEAPDTQRQWHVPQAAQELIRSAEGGQFDKPNPLTPQERQRRRQLQQQRQQQRQQQQQQQQQP